MPPNSVVKTSLIVGGLTFLGFMAGGRLGSMFGAVIGTVVCSMLNIDEPPTGFQDPRPRDENPRFTPYPRPSNTNRNNKNKVNKSKNEPCELSKCSICLEPFKASIVLLPCSHMCFCDECFEKVKKKRVTNCPICRENIDDFMDVYPS
ncbi:cell growth regulator with RING finger domain protein 1 [Acyrthosiphon pisum]|uniref:RING-type domain-containing protein n=1 Tax=Acyrthosiphon pisum TaxID=7029 RepID=A0A8R2D5P8_ACYPI|nr:cell growth regulator with RING finger domain protein 1 [Acyrthosiphon pisum]XP_003246872.1 cell growth regulator with RING finger domain protein 1 [Acyrthosiphon pisum]XP_016662790.1 cell growth regulator with RING finger domain protein 1 [Acyrthosiphon pisum]XP_016662791.1 cell growth regulator with RING finger domain protein 1 [Acyrthosiphon pisum]XP_016662792.1 cell growth regulator with RING finger domain protein 1 [Acyrthosiphon pisum]|eukprot:XP_001947269.1 PREDICTED: cell growth regulator with RING finger domain protein 1 [Acyrthosiphon pisum]